MKVLITSGGTIVPIDTVRRITNMSSGTFGSKIAIEALRSNLKVIFLKAAGSKSPFTANIDLNISENPQIEELIKFYKTHKHQYTEYTYRTFEEYLNTLKFLVQKERPDITILAAAVSDYGVEPVNGKIRSTEQLSIQLKPLPKVISYIKKWCPTTKLIGFKLLVHSNEKLLFDAAMKSIHNNECDFVVANDLDDIKKGKHKLLLVFPNGTTKKYEQSDNPNDPNELAKMVVYNSVSLVK